MATDTTIQIPTFNVYCDESCHLEKDGESAMVLGAVWCSSSEARRHADSLRALKVKFGLSPKFEIKWTKVSESKSSFYLELVKHFFAQSDLHFRGVLVPDKTKLDHATHHQSHDDWYYKLYFDMLKLIISPHARYRIYVDIKDTWGGSRVAQLRKVLSNSKYDFAQTIIERIQIMRSEEFEVLQLADLLVGAVSYVAREKKGNKGKERVVDFIRTQTHYSLLQNTLMREEKFNLLRWSPWEMR